MKHDWLSEEPPVGHTERVLSKSEEFLRQRRKEQQWRQRRQWLSFFVPAMAMSFFGVWFYYKKGQEPKDLPLAQFIQNYSEEVLSDDFEWLAEVDMDLNELEEIMEEEPS